MKMKALRRRMHFFLRRKLKRNMGVTAPRDVSEITGVAVRSQSIIQIHNEIGTNIFAKDQVDSNNRRVYVGNFGEDGIRIVPEGDSRLIDGKVGLILAKQPDLKLDSH